jgi:excinuclease ABC subunit C
LPDGVSAASDRGGLMRRNGPAVVGRLPSTPGVYRFRDARDRVLYIGRAGTLRRRVASYWSDLGERDHLAAMVARIVRIEAVSCDSAHEAVWLERNLLETSLPPWNRTLGGQESAAYIRLDAGPVKPGLSVAFKALPQDQAAYFGPYLGNRRVRHAVSALNRLLPLACTGARLGGAERDLARVRGFAGGDRAALIGSLTAILDRQPAAVSWAQNQLEQLRDRAARSLAYEFAARVQDEIEALGWVSCPQRATTMEAVNLTISGWSRGTLIQFLIRDGRLCGWSQRSSSLANAAPVLASTPAAWRDFTQRNAELAANLAPPA